MSVPPLYQTCRWPSAPSRSLASSKLHRWPHWVRSALFINGDSPDLPSACTLDHRTPAHVAHPIKGSTCAGAIPLHPQSDERNEGGLARESSAIGGPSWSGVDGWIQPAITPVHISPLFPAGESESSLRMGLALPATNDGRMILR